MNSIVRNFIFVISRFKMASFLNVAGLSVAFTAFLILFMQIRYEWGYDRFHKHADRLYRLEIVFNNTGAQVVLNRPLIDRFLASSPHIEEGALINQWGDKIYITVDRDGERMTFQEKFCVCYPSYARVFDFDMVEGEACQFPSGSNPFFLMSLIAASCSFGSKEKCSFVWSIFVR